MACISFGGSSHHNGVKMSSTFVNLQKIPWMFKRYWRGKWVFFLVGCIYWLTCDIYIHSLNKFRPKFCVYRWGRGKHLTLYLKVMNSDIAPNTQIQCFISATLPQQISTPNRVCYIQLWKMCHICLFWYNHLLSICNKEPKLRWSFSTHNSGVCCIQDNQETVLYS
jgi:hypothetical protein